MKMTLRQRQWLRKNPAPSPTPEGFVYAKFFGKLQLVKADELQAACKRSIGMLDDLPEQIRQRAKETGEVPNAEQVQLIQEKLEYNKHRVGGFVRAF